MICLEGWFSCWRGIFPSAGRLFGPTKEPPLAGEESLGATAADGLTDALDEIRPTQSPAGIPWHGVWHGPWHGRPSPQPPQGTFLSSISSLRTTRLQGRLPKEAIASNRIEDGGDGHDAADRRAVAGNTTSNPRSLRSATETNGFLTAAILGFMRV